jgi:hypothetical protein
MNELNELIALGKTLPNNGKVGGRSGYRMFNFEFSPSKDGYNIAIGENWGDRRELVARTINLLHIRQDHPYFRFETPENGKMVDGGLCTCSVHEAVIRDGSFNEATGELVTSEETIKRYGGRFNVPVPGTDTTIAWVNVSAGFRMWVLVTDNDRQLNSSSVTDKEKREADEILDVEV